MASKQRFTLACLPVLTKKKVYVRTTDRRVVLTVFKFNPRFVRLCFLLIVHYELFSKARASVIVNLRPLGCSFRCQCVLDLTKLKPVDHNGRIITGLRSPPTVLVNLRPLGCSFRCHRVLDYTKLKLVDHNERIITGLRSPPTGPLITTGFYSSQPSAVGLWDIASAAAAFGLYLVEAC